MPKACEACLAPALKAEMRFKLSVKETTRRPHFGRWYVLEKMVWENRIQPVRRQE